MRNLRFAFRTLFRTPFVTGVAILSLALGIGANAAVFSMFNQILLRPLPVDDPKVRQPDITRARTLLGWEPRVDVDEGLRQTIDWFRQKLDR